MEVRRRASQRRAELKKLKEQGVLKNNAMQSSAKIILFIKLPNIASSTDLKFGH